MTSVNNTLYSLFRARFAIVMSKRKNTEQHQRREPDEKLLTYRRDFLSESEAEGMFSFLSSSSFQDVLQHTHYRIFNRLCRSGRKQAWISDNPNWTYVFSRNHIAGIDSHPWSRELTKIRKLVEAETGEQFNAVLVNMYDAEDYYAWHSDNDPWLGTDFIVASVSIGSSRDFVIRRKKGKDVKTYKLENGSLCIMHAGMQDTHEHAIPKIPKRNLQMLKIDKWNGRRFNLTFRKVIPELLQKQPKAVAQEWMDEKLAST